MHNGTALSRGAEGEKPSQGAMLSRQSEASSKAISKGAGSLSRTALLIEAPEAAAARQQRWRDGGMVPAWWQHGRQRGKRQQCSGGGSLAVAAAAAAAAAAQRQLAAGRTLTNFLSFFFSFSQRGRPFFCWVQTASVPTYSMQ
jgi:hypothetical protein